MLPARIDSSAPFNQLKPSPKYKILKLTVNHTQCLAFYIKCLVCRKRAQSSEANYMTESKFSSNLGLKFVENNL